MEIAIVGAGIGGLSLALALHRHGVLSEVHESVPEVREIGVGITLLPHAMRELALFGRASDVPARLQWLGPGDRRCEGALGAALEHG
jgi:5-methylphenazine-1-carboxylate 1-monooxygenase